MLQEEEEEKNCAVWFCVTVSVTIADFCVVVFKLLMFLIVLHYI